MIVFYDHERRQCFREDVGNQSVPMDLDSVRAAFHSHQITDCNLAFNRLADYDFDMDAVERSYKVEDSQ